ncbi:unnamed protein product [Hymenolepis diminuta]|uniref:Leucine-rich repeat-containing protein 56 n=1 Tax=Hymenolepis diminuta TaxID=6216 RepID=A0A0R3SJY4_HYMDI|nr:unnamed protein product [Hymenolepis diminuta]
MHGLENFSNITILNLAYNDISKIDSKFYIISLVELISLYQPNHKEPALIDFLSSLNSEAIRQGESRFLKPSETGRRFANSRAKILKRGISAANELSQNLIKWNTPPKWLQRARSVQNVAESTEDLNPTSVVGLTGSLREFHTRKRLSVVSYNFVRTSNQHLLRSESVFVPIENGHECQRENDLKKSPQSLSTDLSDSNQKPTSAPNTKEKNCHIKSSRHRQTTQGRAFSCFQRQIVSSDSDGMKEEERVKDEPTLCTTSEKIDRL